MSEPDEQSTGPSVGPTTGESVVDTVEAQSVDAEPDAGPDPEPDAGPDPVAELVARAREACVDHPELLEIVEQLDRLDEVELARRPEVLDQAHQTLRQVLTGAGRPTP